MPGAQVAAQSAARSRQEPARSLLARRLVIVTGKGGTGKTTVAAALALAAGRAGQRTLVVEVGPDEHVPRLFEPDPAPVGYAGRDLGGGVRAMRIDPYEALGEYLGIQIGVRSVVELVLRNRGFRQLLQAAPGWRELITLGKVWHLEQMRDEAGDPLHDLIVVDAPATGHGVSFLDAPRVVVSAVRAGPLRRNAARVEALLEDPARCVLLPVALGEELPARETVELLDRVREQVGVPVDRVVVNAVAPPPFPEALSDLERRLAGLPADLDLGALPPPPVLGACAGFLRARHELNRRYAEQLARETRLPIVQLPLLDDGVRGPDSLARLAEPLLAPPPAAAT